MAAAAAAATVEAVGVAGGRRRRSGSVALGDLLRREASAERASASASAGAGGRERERRPSVAAGQACRAKKGEDFALLKPACERLPAGGAPFSAFAVSARVVPSPPLQ